MHTIVAFCSGLATFNEILTIFSVIIFYGFGENLRFNKHNPSLLVLKHV